MGRHDSSEVLLSPCMDGPTMMVLDRLLGRCVISPAPDEYFCEPFSCSLKNQARHGDNVLHGSMMTAQALSGQKQQRLREDMSAVEKGTHLSSGFQMENLRD